MKSKIPVIDNKGLDKIEVRFDNVEVRLDKIETRLGVLESDVSMLKLDVRQIDKKLDGLIDNLTDWKSQVFDALDVFMRETHDLRDFKDIGSHQITSNTTRIEVLERKVFGSAMSI
jgi:hypothetical protein